MTYILSAASPLQPADAPVERHMSRLIEEHVSSGIITHPMSIIEVIRDAAGRITDYFESELPFTAFHSETLVIKPSAVHIS